MTNPTDGPDGTADQRIDDLERRVRELEDEREIHHVLIAYGFAVDSGDAAGTGALYTADSRTVIDHTPSRSTPPPACTRWCSAPNTRRSSPEPPT